MDTKSCFGDNSYLVAQFPLSIPDAEDDPHKCCSFCTSNRRDVADLSTLFRHFHRSIASAPFNFTPYLDISTPCHEMYF